MKDNLYKSIPADHPYQHIPCEYWPSNPNNPNYVYRMKEPLKVGSILPSTLVPGLGAKIICNPAGLSLWHRIKGIVRYHIYDFKRFIVNRLEQA